MKKITQRESRMYATNLLVPNIAEDPVMGLVPPTEQDIIQAKRNVDANEK